MLLRVLIMFPLMEGCKDLKEMISTSATVHPHFRACKTWPPLSLLHFGCGARGHQRQGCKNIQKGNHFDIDGNMERKSQRGRNTRVTPLVILQLLTSSHFIKMNYSYKPHVLAFSIIRQVSLGKIKSDSFGTNRVFAGPVPSMNMLQGTNVRKHHKQGSPIMGMIWQGKCWKKKLNGQLS